MRSRAGVREASSSTADTGHWVNCCDLRCNTEPSGKLRQQQVAMMLRRAV